MGENVELLEKNPLRVGSLCRQDTFCELKKAFENNDVQKFEEILISEDKRKKNESPDDYKTGYMEQLLHTVCKNKKYHYAELLIKFGANPNFFDTTYQVAPIHIVCKQGDLKTLKVLLSCPNIDINVRDTFGSTAIHYAVKHLPCLEELLKCSHLDINIANRKGETVFHAAVKGNCLDAIEVLIGKLGKSHNIDLDHEKSRGKTSRLAIIEKYPHLAGKLSEIEEKQEFKTNRSLHDLFVLLEEDTEKFIEIIEDYSQFINESDGVQTFLQYSCEKGLLNVVDKLIEMGVDPNATGRSMIITDSEGHEDPSGILPSMLAAHNGYKNILKSLCRNNETKFFHKYGSILHCVIEGSIKESQKSDCTEYMICLQYILENIPKSKFDINMGNIKGNTALHLAARLGNKDMILLLLKHGAYIGSCNILGEPAFARIKREILNKALDECIRDNNKLPQDDNYEIIFDYNILAPVDMTHINGSQRSLAQVEEGINLKTKMIYETDVLVKICDSYDFDELLKHPVISSFLHLKWDKICKYFYFNVLLYLIFWVLFTTYILGIYSAGSKMPENENNTTDNVDTSMEDDNKSKSKLLMQILVTIFLIFIIIRETFQFLTSPRKYILNAENWLEIGIIIITIWILCDQNQFPIRQQVSAVGILLSWAELVLLVGRFPSLSTYIEMLKTVTMNFLKFLSWYSILIVAFALSFYTLFHQSQSDDFEDLGVSTFKTVIMLTGEFDADSIPFVQHPGTSHILFVIFVFLIAIVLFNLLNGLAVSDTQKIKSDAELVGYKSRVKLISYIESMLNNPFLCIHKLKSVFCCLPQWKCDKNQSLETFKISICSQTSHYPKVRVLPNLGNRVEIFSQEVRDKKKEFENEPNWLSECSTLQMRPEVIRSAKQVLDARKNIKDEHFLEKRIICLEEKIDKILRLLEDKNNYSEF